MKRIKDLISKNIYAHTIALRSDSDDGKYVKFVKKAVNNEKYFSQFKRHPDYRKILEHVSVFQGEEYLKIVCSRPDEIFDLALKSVFITDAIGNPYKYYYNEIEIPLSPTTLRYLKVASDLYYLFGDQLFEIAEIGCGYGGQCLVNDSILNYKHTTLFDLPVVGDLIDKYLNQMLMNGAYNLTTLNKELPKKYDLVISNYAFSELPRLVQIKYIDKVLTKSIRGYLTMNSGKGCRRSRGKLRLDELRKLLPPFDTIEENPQTGPDNYIIIWGHNDTVCKKMFKPFNFLPIEDKKNK